MPWPVAMVCSPGARPLAFVPIQHQAMGKTVHCMECGKVYRDLDELEDLRDNDSVCLVCNNTIEVADWDRILASYEDDEGDVDDLDEDWDESDDEETDVDEDVDEDFDIDEEEEEEEEEEDEEEEEKEDDEDEDEDEDEEAEKE